MLTEIVEVLAKITEMTKKNISANEAAETIIRESKYNRSVIAAAYSWIHEKDKQSSNSRKTANSGGSKSFRTLSNNEVILIGLKNYNYLLHFYNIGLITNNDFEEIIEELKFFPEESIKIENINLLILSLFLDLDKLTLPGSRLLLYSSDTIN